MKGNKFLAAVLAASMAFSMAPVTAANVFADNEVVAVPASDATLTNLTGNLKTVNGKDVTANGDALATEVSQEAATIYNAIKGATLAGTTDATKTAIEAALSSSDTKHIRTVISTTLTSASTEGDVVISGSDGVTYTFTYSTVTVKPIEDEAGKVTEKTALDDLFNKVTAVTYDDKAVSVADVQSAVNKALAAAKADPSNAFFSGDGNTIAYIVKTATASSDGSEVTGEVQWTESSDTYSYQYTATLVKNSQSESDVIKAAMQKIQSNTYPSFDSTDTDEESAVIAKIKSDIEDIAGTSFKNLTVSVDSLIEATHTGDGVAIVTVNGTKYSLKLTHSSSQKIAESNKAITKTALKTAKTNGTRQYTLYAKDSADGTTTAQADNAASDTYVFLSSSALSKSVQASDAKTAVDTETVRAAVEKAVTDATKDFTDDGVTYKVEAYDGTYMDGDANLATATDNDAQTKATPSAEGTYIFKVTTSTANDFYGLTGADTAANATAGKTYYVIVKTHKLKAVKATALSLSDKTVILKKDYHDISGNARDIVEIKPELTPEDSNDSLTWTIKKNDENKTDITTTDAVGTVYDADGNKVTVSQNSGKFIIAAKGTYTIKVTDGTLSDTMTLTVRDNFKDVSPSAYYEKPAQWAYQNNITAGVTDTTFGPNQKVTRAQYVTWLYACAVSQDESIAIADSDVKDTFSDVSKTAYYAKAVQWAVDEGVTGGTSATTFSPNKTITRAEAITMVWAANGRHSAGTGSESQAVLHFTDVLANAWYATAVTWAVQSNVTSGTSTTTFGPNSTCTRGQAITFIYNALSAGTKV